METGGHSPANPVGRRTLLASGLGALSVGAFSLTGREVESEPPPRPHNAVTVERVHSRARHREVELVTIAPEGVPHADLPVCVLFHERHRTARESVDLMWAPAVNTANPPQLAFVSVDGGKNGYWREHPEDDPMRMMLEEVPGWLKQRGLGGPNGLPRTAAGYSMGGYGALDYTRRRQANGTPLAATAVLSPSLFTSWQEVEVRNAFASKQQWAALDPLRHTDELGDVALAVWCGTEDFLLESTRRFAELTDPEVVSFGPGVHEDVYFHTVLPHAVSFVGRHRAETA
ncbi:hypothetical protein FHX42_002716 [Saccharopolyspora lacisalsi]|uniref:Trehalose O-mycolyltransferase n=1 Tax=Halosaccharopolyspora lacisalsi TaxID=1000566 RepID=A0A839E106_9PSEU|nr:alpha/beta hydrolase [Halosaccharopolyspora lacisalsi]MBA8825365.1 hypothetical protein [Halosaccharopolyspora lacisalsi]